MAFDRFMIAPINTGLETDQKPWIIPDDAFAQLDNAYIFRGRVRKRFGSELMGSGWSSPATAPLFSRFRVQVGTVGAPASPVPGAVGAIGQQFSVLDEIFTVVVANGATLHTGASTMTFNTATGAFVLTNNSAFPGATPIWWYPALPVMGLTNYEVGAINNQPSYGFDTNFAYVFAGGFWQRSFTTTSTPSNVPTFHGTNSDFFWASNWQGITANLQSLFVTNDFVNNPNGSGIVTDDPIWTFDGTTWSPYSYLSNLVANPTNAQPLTVTRTGTNGTIITNYIQQAKIILPFKDRLVMLNTIENNANGADQYNNNTTTGNTPARYLTSTNMSFAQRCRYSHNGSPFAANAWLEPNLTYQPAVGGPIFTADGAGFIDAPTDEQIISAEFIKDRLIVYFERSTWELVYTQNQVLPFVWQKINTELGSEAKLSSVPFDKVVLTIGTTGVHACNGANVERIDSKIPDQVFQIRSTNDGIDRVAGVRDYFTEMVYWTFPVSNAPSNSSTYPTKVFIYNYKNGSWAFNDDCITAWGYFEQQGGKTWANSLETWMIANFAWNSGTIQAEYRQVIAGNQQGFVFIIDSEESRNAPVMQITNMVGSTLTIINHSLNVNDFLLIENGQGSTNLNGIIVQVTGLVTTNSITISIPALGVYTGGATAARVSRINILSKQWNPYVDKDRNFYLSKIDFLVDNEGGAAEVFVDFMPSSTELSMTAFGAATGALLGTNVLSTAPYPLNNQEVYQERLWHPVYFQAEGNGIQINITLNDAEMLDSSISLEDFELHAMTLYTTPTTSRLE